MKNLKFMLLLVFSTSILLFLPAGILAQDAEIGAEREKEMLTELLYDFLEGASYNDPETHERFWADELIYTGSNGSRSSKADIMDGLSGTPDRSVEPETRYDADEVQINVYGDMAVVAFRLIADINEPDVQEIRYFYNTGTFRKQNGEWRAVAWQATIIP
jgi:ketosteroid isomerase-like protein